MSALAGRFAPRADGGGSGRLLEAALRFDGACEATASGPVSLAWTRDAEVCREPVCVVDGRPRTDRLAAEIAADPATPPAELIADGFRLFGDSVLRRLRGDFALVLWDAAAGRGLLARDPVGARALFVAEHGGALLFASEIRNLLAMLPARPAPDPVAVAHWLARTSGRHDRTLFEGIRRLPAGHAVRLFGERWERFRHWRPRYVPPPALTPQDAAEAIRAGLAAAVGRAIGDVARPGVMLSGGLDSAAVAAAAHAARPGTAAYSVVFPEDGAVDESSRVAATRDWLGLPGTEAAFLGGSPLAANLEFLREWEVPSVTPNLFIWLPLLRRAAADGVDVMLDGEGGDELFGCAAYLVADELLRGRPLRALRVARRLPGMGDDPRPRLVRRALVRYGLRPALPISLHEPLRRARGRSSMPGWLTGDARVAHATGDDPWGWKRTRAPRWWAQLLDSVTERPEALGSADHLRREGALAGLELRHPLRDPELIELVLTLPPEPAFDPHVDRALARRALTGALPPEVLDDDSKPVFNSQFARAIEGRDGAELRALLADPHPELARRVRRDALAALVADPARAARQARLGADLWRLASLELWLAYGADPGVADRVAERLEADARVSFADTVGG